MLRSTFRTGISQWAAAVWAAGWSLDDESPRHWPLCSANLFYNKGHRDPCPSQGTRHTEAQQEPTAPRLSHAQTVRMENLGVPLVTVPQRHHLELLLWYLAIILWSSYLKDLDIQDSVMRSLGWSRWGNLVWLCESRGMKLWRSLGASSGGVRVTGPEGSWMVRQGSFLTFNGEMLREKFPATTSFFSAPTWWLWWGIFCFHQDHYNHHLT